MSKIERDKAVKVTQEKEDVVINEELLMDFVKTFLTYDLLMCKVKELSLIHISEPTRPY